MRYAIVDVINGNFKVRSEHGDDKQAAIVAFHDRCKVLWNAPDVITAMVKVVDENFDCVDGKAEFIAHPEPVQNNHLVEETEPEG